MSCPRCVGALAWADQLQSAYDAREHYETILLERVQKAEKQVQSLERQLREALDELRLRRAATGYLPVLDQPSPDSA